MSKHKRSYKDSVFVDLFAEDEKVMKNVQDVHFSSGNDVEERTLFLA